MPVTAWTAPRYAWTRQHLMVLTGVYPWSWWVNELAKMRTAIRLGGPSRSSQWPVVADFRTGIPGMTSAWRINATWSGVRAPVAPAGAHRVEWRGRILCDGNNTTRARFYWDQRGVVGKPVSGRYYYAAWDWKRSWADRVFEFGDPRLYSDLETMEPDTRFRAYIQEADLRARFYY